MKNIKVTITQELWDRCKAGNHECDPYYCVIAQAIREQTDLKNPSVGLLNAYVDNPKPPYMPVRADAALSPLARDLARDFDFKNKPSVALPIDIDLAFAELA